MSPRRSQNAWTDLLDRLYDESWNPSLGRFRSPCAFRGGTVVDLLTSRLHRLAAGRRDIGRLERHLLRNFRKYAYGQVQADTVWHWLALAQHRGLPTRLLDWTYSPLVALHFATADMRRMHRDSTIWTFNFVDANRYVPRPLRCVLEHEGSDTVTVDMLARYPTLAAFDRLSRDPFVVFLEPPSLDPRMVNQFALFSLMSSPGARLADWLRTHPGLVRRIVVPASAKWEIRDKLDQANVNERVLFPGLDGLTRWLTRYYYPRASTA
jgi:hypothetical protein